MKLATVSITIAMVAPIGCSVRVETNSPIAPSGGQTDRQVRADGEQPQQRLAERHLSAGEQRHRPAAEQRKPDQCTDHGDEQRRGDAKMTTAVYLTASIRVRCTGTASR